MMLTIRRVSPRSGITSSARKAINFERDMVLKPFVPEMFGYGRDRPHVDSEASSTLPGRTARIGPDRTSRSEHIPFKNMYPKVVIL